MNTILQKRIEEAAKEIGKKFYFVGMNPNEAAYKAAIQMGNKILQNQWIPVKEELPEKDIPNCFVAYRAIDMVLYSTGSYEKDNDEWYVDGFGFNAEVTHWMEIPKLNGNE